MTQTMHRGDQDLQGAVADELLYSPNIDTHVVVAVEDGAVTLSGDVGSLPERIAANGAAHRVWGVKAVLDNMVVRSAGASGATDDDIAQVASQMLSWSVDVPANTVTVNVHNRVITLSGTVIWDFQRRAAARAVSYIRGITGVRNHIALNEKASVSVVKEAVESAIARNAPLDATAIMVEVVGHELTLHGHVRSWAERRQAEHVAWAAAGVSKVNNDLAITS